MEVCLDLETSVWALPYMNLFLDLLCAFLNIDRPVPFASEKKKRKRNKTKRKVSEAGRESNRRPCACEESAPTLQERDCKAESRKHSFLEHRREPVFLPWQPEIKSSLALILYPVHCNYSMILAHSFTFRSWTQNYSSKRTWLRVFLKIVCVPSGIKKEASLWLDV